MKKVIYIFIFSLIILVFSSCYIEITPSDNHRVTIKNDFQYERFFFSDLDSEATVYLNNINIGKISTNQQITRFVNRGTNVIRIEIKPKSLFPTISVYEVTFNITSSRVISIKNDIIRQIVDKYRLEIINDTVYRPSQAGTKADVFINGQYIRDIYTDEKISQLVRSGYVTIGLEFKPTVGNPTEDRAFEITIFLNRDYSIKTTDIIELGDRIRSSDVNDLEFNINDLIQKNNNRIYTREEIDLIKIE